ncbi:hypothetical protein ABES33_28645 [Bacillus pseudomycoides]|uniref:hypothetical protein n=1 Tax=Bacillus pseudomycoides TaxID=64104 RepID=UPI003D1B6E1F
MHKKIISTSLILVLSLSFIAACNNKEDDKFVIFSSSENLSKESKDALIKCLEKNKIKYKEDSKGSILIQKRDENKASARCS